MQRLQGAYFTADSGTILISVQVAPYGLDPLLPVDIRKERKWQSFQIIKAYHGE